MYQCCTFVPHFSKAGCRIILLFGTVWWQFLRKFKFFASLEELKNNKIFLICQSLYFKVFI